MQAQQQRHETLQYQFPQGASEPHPEPAPTPPHQCPKEPDCRGADRVPSLRGKGPSQGEPGGGGFQKGCGPGHQQRGLVGEPGERGRGLDGAGPGRGRGPRGGA